MYLFRGVVLVALLCFQSLPVHAHVPRFFSGENAGGRTFATSRYVFTGEGERIARTQVEDGQSNTVYYLLDRTDAYNRPLAELDATGGVRRIFIWGRGLIAQVSFDATGSGTVHYVHHDGQGSTLALTDSAGFITDQWFYSPYGEILNRSGTNDIPYQWCGGVGVAREPSGLYYMKARYYHPELKRWITVDPIGLAGGINMYAYAALNPLMYFDPMGLCAEGYWREEGPSWGQGRSSQGLFDEDPGYVWSSPGAYSRIAQSDEMALAMGMDAPYGYDNSARASIAASVPAVIGSAALSAAAVEVYGTMGAYVAMQATPEMGTGFGAKVAQTFIQRGAHVNPEYKNIQTYKQLLQNKHLSFQQASPIWQTLKTQQAQYSLGPSAQFLGGVSSGAPSVQDSWSGYGGVFTREFVINPIINNHD